MEKECSGQKEIILLKMGIFIYIIYLTLNGYNSFTIDIRVFSKTFKCH